VNLTFKKRTRNVFSLEMAKLFAWLSAASRVKSQQFPVRLLEVDFKP